MPGEPSWIQTCACLEIKTPGSPTRGVWSSRCHSPDHSGYRAFLPVVVLAEEGRHSSPAEREHHYQDGGDERQHLEELVGDADPTDLSLLSQDVDPGKEQGAEEDRDRAPDTEEREGDRDPSAPANHVCGEGPGINHREINASQGYQRPA